MACVILRNLLVACLCVFGPFRSLAGQPSRDDYPRVSPFDDVRWPAPNAPEVRIDGGWYTVVSIDGLPLESILTKAAEVWGPRDVERRFDEDLGEIMTRLGTPPSAKATLVLRDEAGAEKRLTPLMTAEKRRRLRNARAEGEAQALDSPVPESKVRALYADFAARLASSHAFTIVADPAVRDEIRALPDRARNATLAEIRSELTRILTRTGDGHAAVDLPLAGDLPRFLHCLIEPVGPITPDPTESRFVAIRPDRAAFVDPAHPFVAAIEGKPTKDLIGAASLLIADGSPQLIRRRAARALLTPTLFGILPEPAAGVRTLRLTLADDAGHTVEREIAFDRSLPERIDWPPEDGVEHRIVDTADGPIGYLRVPSMSDGEEVRATVLSALDSFRSRQAIGLIIDVRGNGGGRRDLIDIIGPRLLAPDASPIVYNASRPALLPDESPEDRAERMASRFLYPADHVSWSDAERTAINTFAASFKPTIDIPDDRFGPWHYAALSPAPASTPSPTGPTVVLLDAGCFSATDIFLAAMREIPGVTLVGEPSSGGSGLIVPHVITTPDQSISILVRLSSMLSFQPDGHPFDGVGVVPDVVVPTLPTDRLERGTDSALDAAIRVIGDAPR
jgi:hypothetical protein